MEALFRAKRESRLLAIRAQCRWRVLSDAREVRDCPLQPLFQQLHQCALLQKDPSHSISLIASQIFNTEPSQRLLDFLVQHWQKLQCQTLEAYLVKDFAPQLRVAVSRLVLLLIQQYYQSRTPTINLLRAAEKNAAYFCHDTKIYLSAYFLAMLQTPALSNESVQLCLSILLVVLDQKTTTKNLKRSAVSLLFGLDGRYELTNSWLDCLVLISYENDEVAQCCIEEKGIDWIVKMIELIKHEPVMAESLAMLICNMICTKDRKLRKEIISDGRILDIIFLSLDPHGNYAQYARLVAPLICYTSRAELQKMVEPFSLAIKTHYQKSEHGMFLCAGLKMFGERARFYSEDDNGIMITLQRTGALLLLEDFYLEENE